MANITKTALLICLLFAITLSSTGCAPGTDKWRLMSETEILIYFNIYFGELDGAKAIEGKIEINDSATSTEQKNKIISFSLPENMGYAEWLSFLVSAHNSKFSGVVNHKKLEWESSTLYSSPEDLGFLYLRYSGSENVFELEYIYDEP